MVFKPICECLNLSPLGPVVKHSKRGGHGKQLSLGFYPLFCFLACYGSNTRNFLCIEEKYHVPLLSSLLPFKLFCCCGEESGVMEAENREEIKPTEQEKYSLLRTLRQLEVHEYMTPRKERVDFVDIQVKCFCVSEKLLWSYYINRCQNAISCISVFRRSLSDVFCLSIITVFCFLFHFKKHTIHFLYCWWLLFSYLIFLLSPGHSLSVTFIRNTWLPEVVEYYKMQTARKLLLSELCPCDRR